MATSKTPSRRRGKGAVDPTPPPADPPPNDDDVPPAPDPRLAEDATATKPPSSMGGGATDKDGEAMADEKTGEKRGLWSRIRPYGSTAIALLAGGLIALGIVWCMSSSDNDDESPQKTTTAQAVPPPAVAQPAPSPPPAQPAPAPPAPAAPTPPPPAQPAPTLSAEDLDKRIGGIGEQEVKDCLVRLKSWDVDLSTPSSFDSETANCRNALAVR